MNRRNRFAFLAVMFLFVIAGSARAQVAPPCVPCPNYDVDYSNVYPPAPSGQFMLNIQCADGRIFPATSVASDGHYSYPADPTCTAQYLIISWAGPPPNAYTILIPSGGPFTMSTPWGVLTVNTTFTGAGCLDISLNY